MSPIALPTPSRHFRNQPVSHTRKRMSSLFNTVRASIYGSVVLCTVICLAMAGHFQSVLAASDLTRFVPFAIFVCSASMFIILVLLVFSFFLRDRNPISTRIELASLCLAGIFWLVLGVYLTTSAAQTADVECFSTDGSQTLLTDQMSDFHTDQYHAMYRVLMTFALINAFLVLLSFLALLYLAIRKYRKGDEQMWYAPVTSCAWFNQYGHTKQPTTEKIHSDVLPIASRHMRKHVYTQEPERKARTRRDHSTRPYYTRNPYPTLPKSYSPNTPRYTRQASGSSPHSGSSIADLEKGGMLNPKSTRRS
ncbi:hypothetical protein BYT27DRAFT_7182860 [Phlegmacium glaucopus]|nr:hypothetical protein BYT27DRAFT_7182860 [Phlegmacium glaucopus]